MDESTVTRRGLLAAASAAGLSRFLPAVTLRPDGHWETEKLPPSKPKP